jgi:hypothetical protein
MNGPGMRLSRLMVSRWFSTLLATDGKAVNVRVGSRARMGRVIRRADPFQTIGIPCWQSYAGPLSDPRDID